MSVGFIIFEIIDKDSLKNQGINTTHYLPLYPSVGYSLKYQGINTTEVTAEALALVGYSLKNQGINTSLNIRNHSIEVGYSLKYQGINAVKVEIR